MQSTITVTVEPRSSTGSSAARRLRRQGLLPGTLNLEDGAARSIQANEHAFEQLLRKHSSESLLVDLDLAGEPHKVLLKEVQHDPLNGHLLHFDMVEISMTRRMRVRLPIEVVGEAPGVNAGGVLEQNLREIEVECLPTDLIEVLEIDVSGLGMGDSMRVADIPIDPSKFHLLTPPDISVVAVVEPRVETEPSAEEGETEGSEPEVIGEKEREARSEDKDKD